MISLLVAVRGFDGQRERIWRHLRPIWEAQGYEVVEGTHDEGPWSKGSAWRDALERSHGDSVLFMDADCFCPDIGRHLGLLGGSHWVQTTTVCIRLNRVATAELLSGAEIGPVIQSHCAFEEGEGARHMSAGVGTLLRREDAFLVPVDPRFIGWGWEDTSWHLALTTILGPGTDVSPPSICFHLWHEPQHDKNRAPGQRTGNALLYEQYRRVVALRPEQRRDAMLELISEISEIS